MDERDLPPAAQPEPKPKQPVTLQQLVVTLIIVALGMLGYSTSTSEPTCPCPPSVVPGVTVVEQLPAPKGAADAQPPAPAHTGPAAN